MIVVASTLAPFAMEREECWSSWLRHAEAIAATAGVAFFAAIETDARGVEPFAPLLERLEGLDGEWWRFSLDDGEQERTSHNRLRRIVTGENFASMYAQERAASHLLFLGADVEPDPEVVPKLLEVDWPVAAGNVATYARRGPVVRAHPTTHRQYAFPVQRVLPTASMVLLSQVAFARLPWRYDIGRRMTDDPCMEADATALGVAPLCRMDCWGRHHPETIGPLETRGFDLRILW